MSLKGICRFLIVLEILFPFVIVGIFLVVNEVFKGFGIGIFYQGIAIIILSILAFFGLGKGISKLFLSFSEDSEAEALEEEELKR